MLRNNIIKETDKKLFESRLQMKPKFSAKKTQISFEGKKISDNNLTSLNNTQPFAKVFIKKQMKNNSTLEKSILKNFNKKNRNTTHNLNMSQNKTNILIKDIPFLPVKNSHNNIDAPNKTLINVNTRLSKQNMNLSANDNINDYNNNKQNIKKFNASLTLNIKRNNHNKNKNFNLINSFTRRMATINESNSNITINNNNFIMNNTNININNLNNGNNNRFTIKDNKIPKIKLTSDIFVKIPQNEFKTNLNSKAHNSNSLEQINRYNSYFINKMQKKQKQKVGKKQNIMNQTNFNWKLNDILFGNSQNNLVKGRNTLNIFKNSFSNVNNINTNTKKSNNNTNNTNINKYTINTCKGFTQKNVFFGNNSGKILKKNNNNHSNNINNNFTKNKYSNNNSRQRKQNRTLNFDNYYFINKNINNKTDIIGGCHCINNNSKFNNNTLSNRYLNNSNCNFLYNKNNYKKNIKLSDTCFLKNENNILDKKTSRNPNNILANKTSYNKRNIYQQKNNIDSKNNSNNNNNNNCKNKRNQINNKMENETEIYSQEFGFINDNYINSRGKELINMTKTQKTLDYYLNDKRTINDDELFHSDEIKMNNTSSILEDSGILSMDEVQDIIQYNDMYGINKEDTYLFNYNDYDDFVERNKETILNKFFGKDYKTEKKDNIYFMKKIKLIKTNM